MIKNEKFEGFWRKKSDLQPIKIIRAKDTRLFMQRRNHNIPNCWFILFEGDKYVNDWRIDEKIDFFKITHLEDENFAILLKNGNYTAILVTINKAPVLETKMTLKRFTKSTFSKIGLENNMYLHVKHFQMYSMRLLRDTENKLDTFFTNLKAMSSSLNDFHDVIKRAIDITIFNKSQDRSNLEEYCDMAIDTYRTEKMCYQLNDNDNMNQRLKKDFENINREVLEHSRAISQSIHLDIGSFKHSITKNYYFGSNFVNQNAKLFEKLRNSANKKENWFKSNTKMMKSTERPTMMNNEIKMVEYESSIYIDGQDLWLYSSPFVKAKTIEHVFIDASWIKKHMILAIVGVNKDENTYQTIAFVIAQPKNETETDQKKLSANSKLYHGIIAYLKTIYPITSITCDFEHALTKAAKENDLKIWGCYFHYLQNLRIHTLREAASFQAFQILKLIPLAYLKNLGNLVTKANDVISNGLLTDSHLLEYANKTYFEKKDVIFSLKINSNTDFFKLTNNACERLFNILKKKWKQAKKTTGMTAFHKIRHIIIENLIIDKQTKLGGSKNKKGLIEREVKNLTNSLKVKIEKYLLATNKNNFTNLLKQKIEEKNDSDEDDSDDEDFDDQEDMTNVDGRRMRSTTMNLVNKAKLANPKKALTVTTFKKHLANKKFKETVAIVAEKGIFLNMINKVKEEITIEFQKKLNEQVRETEEEVKAEREAKLKAEEQARRAENQARADRAQARRAGDQARADREQARKAEEQARADREAKLRAEERLMTLEEQFRKKIEELEKKLRKNQTISNEVLATGEPDLNTGNQMLFQINDSKHDIKKDLLKINHNNIMAIETKNTFEKSGKMGKNGEKLQLSKNEVLKMGSQELVTNNPLAYQTMTPTQLNTSPLSEANRKNSDMIKSDDENCNQNLDMGNVFQMVFGTGKLEQLPEKQQQTEKTDTNESKTNEQSKSTKNKVGRPSNKNEKKRQALELACMKNRNHQMKK